MKTEDIDPTLYLIQMSLNSDNGIFLDYKKNPPEKGLDIVNDERKIRIVDALLFLNNVMQIMRALKP